MYSCIKSVLIFPVLIFVSSFMLNAAASASEYGTFYKEARSLPESAADVWLLSTVVSPGSGNKVILKSLSSEKVSSYKEGVNIDITSTDNRLRVVRIFPCLVVIESDRGYEKITCDGSGAGKKNQYLISDSSFSSENITALSSKFDTRFDKYIMNACKRFGVDPNLVKAVIKVESDFNPRAVSPKQARGLMQLISETAQDYGVENVFDPESNIYGGVNFLSDLIEYFQDIEIALAAYNSGKNAVIRHNNSIPPYPETINYVEKVMNYYSHLKIDLANR